MTLPTPWGPLVIEKETIDGIGALLTIAMLLWFTREMSR